MSDRLTDEQLRRLTDYVHPDDATRARPWLHSMAAELLAARARVAELESNVVTLDRVSDELGCTREQLDLWFARGVVVERDNLRDRNAALVRLLDSAEREADELREVQP